MNSLQAEKLSLPDILAKLGYQPVRSAKNGLELWYLSPFRNENTPSFHTSYLGGKWIWNDFGDSGGTVLTFIMRYFQVNAKEGLARLETLVNHNQGCLLSAHSEAKTPPAAITPANEQETLSLRKITSLTDQSFNGRALLQYLKDERGINTQIATHYLVEVQYHNNQKGKTYFAVGIKNEHEGYEIRNKYFKGSIGQKGITLIKGQGKESRIAVFEGFIDFLSALTYYHLKDSANFKQLYESDTLIMNSASFQERTFELLYQGQYRSISLYLDNDLTGQKLKTKLQGELPYITKDNSNLYKDYKDFNEALVKGINIK